MASNNENTKYVQDPVDVTHRPGSAPANFRCPPWRMPPLRVFGRGQRYAPYPHRGSQRDRGLFPTQVVLPPVADGLISSRSSFPAIESSAPRYVQDPVDVTHRPGPASPNFRSHPWGMPPLRGFGRGERYAPYPHRGSQLAHWTPHRGVLPRQLLLAAAFPSSRSSFPALEPSAPHYVQDPVDVTHRPDPASPNIRCHPWGMPPLRGFGRGERYAPYPHRGSQLTHWTPHRGLLPRQLLLAAAFPSTRSSFPALEPSAPHRRPSGKKMPGDPTKMHPVMLLNQLRPNLKYQETTEGTPPNAYYKVTVNIDGQEYVGIGKNKKDAKKNAAKKVLAVMGIIYDSLY